MVEDTLTTIASYSTITDAAIFESQLKMEGIECVVIDSNAPLTPAVPQIHNGGVRLAVREDDVDRALVIINRTMIR